MTSVHIRAMIDNTPAVTYINKNGRNERKS